jgi:hypothetical protein
MSTECELINGLYESRYLRGLTQRLIANSSEIVLIPPRSGAGDGEASIQARYCLRFRSQKPQT